MADEEFQEWVEIETPSGAFAKFNEPGDNVTGKVVAFDERTGGTNFDGDECGVVILAPIGPDADDPDAPEQIIVTLDKPALRDKVKAANPQEGDLLYVGFAAWVESKSTGREYKTFDVRISRRKTTAKGKASARSRS